MFARRTRMRLLGLAIVLAWAGLWATNATIFAAKWGDPRGWLLAVGYALPLVATAIVVARRLRIAPPRGRWTMPRRRRRRTPAPPDVPPPPPLGRPSSNRLRLDTTEVIRAERGLADANVA